MNRACTIKEILALQRELEAFTEIARLRRWCMETHGGWPAGWPYRVGKRGNARYTLKLIRRRLYAG